MFFELFFSRAACGGWVIAPSPPQGQRGGGGFALIFHVEPLWNPLRLQEVGLTVSMVDLGQKELLFWMFLSCFYIFCLTLNQTTYHPVGRVKERIVYLYFVFNDNSSRYFAFAFMKLSKLDNLQLWHLSNSNYLPTY